VAQSSDNKGNGNHRPMSGQDRDHLLTVSEVALLLRQSESQVRQFASNRDLPAVRLPSYGDGLRRSLLFRRVDVERFIEDHVE